MELNVTMLLLGLADLSFPFGVVLRTNRNYTETSVDVKLCPFLSSKSVHNPSSSFLERSTLKIV